jgi:soluble lytic murein transglycosylase
MHFHKRIKLSYLSLAAIICLLLTTFTLIYAGNAGNDPQKDAIVTKTIEYLKGKKIRVGDDKLRVIANTVYEESREYDLDYRLVLAVMKVESNFRQDAVSRDGARGLLQIKPSLARHVSRDSGVTLANSRSLHEPEKNIKIGVNHLSWLVDKFENLTSALHAYNAGARKAESRTAREGFYETRFTRKVMKEYQDISAILPEVED